MLLDLAPAPAYDPTLVSAPTSAPTFAPTPASDPALAPVFTAGNYPHVGGQGHESQSGLEHAGTRHGIHTLTPPSDGGQGEGNRGAEVQDPGR